MLESSEEHDLSISLEATIAVSDQMISSEGEHLSNLYSDEQLQVAFDKADFLMAQFNHGGNVNDLEACISTHREALKQMLKSHIHRVESLDSLAGALKAMFKHGGDEGYLEEAILSYREALQLRPHPHPSRSSSLYSLASTLKYHVQLHQGKDMTHYLDESIVLYREVLQLRPHPHPNRALTLNNLASALKLRFSLGGNKEHLSECISLHREALLLKPHPNPSRPLSLNNLADALQTQFNHGGDRKLLVESTSLYREALELRPHHHPNRPLSLSNLAETLKSQFKHGGDQNHLEESISLGREAVQLTPPLHLSRPLYLNNLADALVNKFKHEGDRKNLEEAILLHREGLQLTSRSHPNRPLYINNLAEALMAQFRHSEDIRSLNESISLHREALELLPHPHPDRSLSLNNLADALKHRFNFFEEGKVSLHRKAFTHRLPHSPIHQSGAAKTSKSGSQVTKSDIDEIIGLQREALRTAYDSHPQRSIYLVLLGVMLSKKFSQDGRHQDYEESISLCKQALQIESQVDTPVRHFVLHSLGTIYLNAMRKTGVKNDKYLKDSMHAFSTSLMSSRSVSPFSIFATAVEWALHADQYDHETATEAYDAAIECLPQMTSVRHSIQLRHEILVSNMKDNTVARNASLYAIRIRRFDKAIEYLEAGRTILWSQILQLRSPFDELNSIAPEVGNRLQEIATALERASHGASVDTQGAIQGQTMASQLTRWTVEWETKLAEVRKLNGFQDFLRPRRFLSLQKAASICPIVLLLPSKDGSYCLILTSDSIHHIAVPSLTNKKLRSLAKKVGLATSQKGPRTAQEDATSYDTLTLALMQTVRNPEKRLNSHRVSTLPTSNTLFRDVLKVLWDKIVNPVIKLLGIKGASQRSRLQWCPTGLFTFLPIHAAGAYSTGDGFQPPECASDYIISSYIPTLGVLLDRDSEKAAEPFKMMVIVDKALSAAQRELENIRKWVPKNKLNSLMQLGGGKTQVQVTEVMSHLSTASIIHFACHGMQDKSHPLDSALYLARDTPLMISKIMERPLPNGSIAFLCACQTAMGDHTLPDESISIGASLIFSGFRSVIATMWEIKDEDGPNIADSFYEELFRGFDGNSMSQPDVTRSAFSLDFAVQKLRLSGVPFRDWVPFVHLGK